MSSRTLSRMMRNLRWRVATPVLRVAPGLMVRLSRRGLMAWGRALGTLAYALAPRERWRAFDHLSLAFPHRSGAWIRACARRSFENLAIGLLETLIIHRLSDEAVRELLVNPEELEQFIAAHQTPPGPLVVTGHLGNWELLASLCARFGGSVRVVGRRMHERHLDDLLTALRAAGGVEVLRADESPRAMIDALRKGTGLGILPDQDISELEGVFVDFFGREAYTPTAPARLALVARAPLYTMFLLREGDRFRVRIEGPLGDAVSFSSRDRDAAILRLTQLWTDSLERAVRAAPDQWVWMHRRWRNTPDRLAGRRAAGRVGRKR